MGTANSLYELIDTNYVKVLFQIAEGLFDNIHMYPLLLY